MFIYIFTIILGGVCIFLGTLNTKGNISSIHSYHRSRVAEEDVLPFGRLVGLGTIIIGISIILYGVLSIIGEFGGLPVFFIVASVVLILGIVIGLILSFYAMIKYNKGIF